MTKDLIIRIFLLPVIFLPLSILGMRDTPLGQLDFSATLTGIYDSRVFGISEDLFNKSRNGSNGFIKSDELESQDDFILKFSPAVHFNRKISLLRFAGSAGVEIAQFIKNNEKSYIIPITNFVVDFDDTLSKRKTISNNARIRFDATFDIGQHIGASVLEQDLISYTYFQSGINVRYNHSAKFGLGAGTDYSYRHYQSGSTGDPRLYNDISNLPLHARAFYIYSEKLDFFSQYTFTRSQSHGKSTLADSKTHSISFGANGEMSSKLSGTASIGYSYLNFDDFNANSQNSVITSTTLNWKINTKSSSFFSLSRNFSPSSQGFSNLSTNSRIGLNHRFLEDLSGSAYLSLGHSKYTYPSSNPAEPNRGETSSMKTYGLGFNINKIFSKVFSGNAGYNFSFTDRSIQEFDRHLITIQLTGRF